VGCARNPHPVSPLRYQFEPTIGSIPQRDADHACPIPSNGYQAKPYSLLNSTNSHSNTANRHTIVTPVSPSADATTSYTVKAKLSFCVHAGALDSCNTTGPHSTQYQPHPSAGAGIHPHANNTPQHFGKP
jgi:hypothetical protein